MRWAAKTGVRETRARFLMADMAAYFFIVRFGGVVSEVTIGLCE